MQGQRAFFLSSRATQPSLGPAPWLYLPNRSNQHPISTCPPSASLEAELDTLASVAAASATVPGTPEKPLAMRRSTAAAAAIASPATVPAGVRRVQLGSTPTFVASTFDSASGTAAPATGTTIAQSMLGDDFIPGLTYEYFPGTFESLPNFDELKPSQSGITPHCALQSLIDAGVVTAAPNQGK